MIPRDGKGVLNDSQAARPPAVIHVDLDGATEIFAAHRERWSYADDPIFGTGMRHLLEFLDENELRVTLFVIASNLDDPEKRPLLEEAVRRGHEVASHTMTHAHLRGLESRRKRMELGESRTRLEQSLGVPVRGFRAPGYSIDRECLEILSENGYEWDSSAFQTSEFATRLGIDIKALSQLGRPFGPNPLIELPLPEHRPSPFPVTPSYALVFGRQYFRWGFNRYARTGRPLVLLFHLIDFASPLPADRIPGWKLRQFTLSTMDAQAKRQRCQEILDQVRHTYRLMTTSTLIREFVAPEQPPDADTARRGPAEGENL